MSQVAPSIRETPFAKFPGWVIIHELDAYGEPHNARYRGPGGEMLTKHEFYKRVKTGEIVAAPDPEATPTTRPAALSTSTSPAGHASSSLGSSAPTDEPPALDLPDAKPKKTAPGVASAAELSLTATIGLIMLTSVVAWLFRAPEMTMSQTEAQAIAVPLANITAPSELNRRFGRYLAGSSDYTLLGYALYAYGYRVLGQLQQRQAIERAQQSQQTPQPGRLHVAPTQTARPVPAAQPGPAGAPGPVNGATGDSQRGAAVGGIAGAASGYVPAEASRIVGYNPIPPSRPA